MSTSLATRLQTVDPGFVRTRRGARAACATVLAWAAMVAVTAAFDVVDPFRINLFAAGAAFEGALLAPDPQPRDRVRTLGLAFVVAAVAVVVAVALNQLVPWASALLLVTLMFLSYALRGCSTRAASLALMGAITVYVTGAGYITPGRIGWFVVALAVGFSSITLWEKFILPEDPLRSLRRSIVAFSARAAEAVECAVLGLTTAQNGDPPDQAHNALREAARRVQSCRTAIESQLPGAVLHGLSAHNAELLRVSLYAADRGVQELAEATVEPVWRKQLPNDFAASAVNTLHALSAALGEGATAEAQTAAAGHARVLRSHLDAGEASLPFETLLAACEVLGAGERIARAVSQAGTLTALAPATDPVPPETPAAPAAPDGLTPAMALAIQSVVAALGAGLIARLVGNEQSLVVAWTAFVVIAGSAGASRRRAWSRLPATILGAIGGVVIAACIPGTVLWTIAVVMVGVFFTIVTAPVSYPAMVFWMSIAFIPIFATEGQYFDLIRDKSVAAFIGGGVAAVVVVLVVPIRSSHGVRPAVSSYLHALDRSLASHLSDIPADGDQALAELDRAHAQLGATAASAAAETQIFNQAGRQTDDEVGRVAAVHDAYLRLTPLLSETSRRLHGWTDDRLRTGIDELRDAVAAARAGSPSPLRTVNSTAGQHKNAPPADSRRLLDDLHARLAELGMLLGRRP